MTQELLFDLLVFLAAGLTQTSLLLGIGVDPLPTLALGAALIITGVLTVVPRNARVPAAVTGILGLVVAGWVVPSYAARAVQPEATLRLSLLLAGVILLVTVALLRVTTFRPQTGQSA